MKTIGIGLALSAAAALAACATQTTPTTAQDSATRAAASAVQPAPQATAIPGGMQVSQVTTATVKVKKIDQKTRMVTIQAPDGTTNTFRVDDSVKNLAQVKAGDDVVLAYYEAVAITLKKKGEAVPSMGASEQLVTAEPGEKPGAIGARVITVIAKITAIDKQKSTATLTGPEGKSITVNVRNPENLERAKVGDLVEITYTEAVAVGVEKAPKKK